MDSMMQICEPSDRLKCDLETNSKSENVQKKQAADENKATKSQKRTDAYEASLVK